MRLDAQLARVQRAEHRLQDNQQHSASCCRQFAQHWRSSWTPTRIIGAGLLTGFAAGFAKPQALLRSGELLKLVSTVSNLLAVLSAYAPTEHASTVADASATSAAD